jgi:serine/threonine protein kinase
MALTPERSSSAMILSESTDARYQIVKILGQGGSADVYLARHIALGELRVLKILHQEMVTDPKRRGKFFLEAQLAAHLKHPAIVHVYDVTQSGSKLQIEMEYIDGWSLRQQIEQRGHLPQSIALALMVGILEGLAHAHHARLTFDGVEFDGVIHRDLKPENILIRKNGQPVICDFGVAKLGADLHSMTQNISGSVAYMAPERLRGEVSTRSIDIFALGVMLYELIKGSRPFPSRNQGEAIESLMQWRLADIETELQGVDDGIVQVIRKSLARESAQRYQDASQMLEALRPIYRLYHGDASPDMVLKSYLTTGQFTTAEFRALLPEGGEFGKRWLFMAAAAVVAVGLGWWTYRQAQPTEFSETAKEAQKSTSSQFHDLLRKGDLVAARVAVDGLPQGEERQNGFFALAQAYLDRGDAGNALLLTHKALEPGFHPTIAALRARIYLDQDMPNMALNDLEQIGPWLPKMTPTNQAQCHWLRARLERRLMEQNPTAGNRVKAVESLQAYLRLDPGDALGHHAEAKAYLKRASSD